MFLEPKGRHSRLGGKEKALGAMVDKFTWSYKMLHDFLALPHDWIHEHPDDEKGSLKVRKCGGG